MRHSRFIAYTLIVTLMASVIAGALGVTLHFAKADAGDVMYLGDLESELVALAPQHQSDIETFFAVCEINLASPNVWVSVIKKGTNYICTCWQITNQNYNYTLTGLTDTSGGQMFSGVLQRPYPNYSGFQDFYFSYVCSLYFKYQDDVFYFRTNGGGSTYLTSNRTWPNSFGTSAENFAFPNYYDLNDPDTEVYCTKDISTFIQNYGFNFTANLFLGSSVPPEIEFECATFWLGERQYLTVKDQYLMYSMIDYNNEGEVLRCFRANVWTDAEEYVSLYLPYEDTVLIEGGQNFVNGLENVSAAGVYAWDITDKGLITVNEMYIYDYVDGSTGDIYRGYATNCPYDLTKDDPGSNGQPDSYTNSWTIFNDYITNYNSTHVIPDNLVDSIFGVNGFKIYPCDVQIPTNCWTGISVAGYHTFKFHMNVDELGLNYDLMDVVIVPQSEFGKYGLVYFYDDSLQTPYVFVDFIDYKDLLEQFDIIIIVDDTGHCLEENAWWQQIISSIVWDWADYMAVSGSSSMGVSYSETSLTDNIEHGYAIVTKRAIQRQQLYLFNDGITKTYKLMSDYIDKRGDWEDSFLTWTSGLFAQWQTLDGRLSDIYSLLYGLNLSAWMDGISSKLDTLVENTAEIVPDHWFPSLWNWVSQFKPSNLDFIFALDAYDDNWDRFPQLPAPSPVPALPTIQGG